MSDANAEKINEEIKTDQKSCIRTRIAPSPTGPMHIGVVRTALFNYLFAKKNNGKFILRIEDTDIERSKIEWEKNIIESLKWLGIQWDEGPDIDGKYAPYRQSQRTQIYAKYLKKLLEEGKAYYCFCSKEDIEAKKQYQMSAGEPVSNKDECRDIPQETVKKYLEQGRPSVIKFKVIPKKIKFIDIIRGEVEFDSGLFKDFVIAKNLFNPLYNLTVVVDDFEMKISHIIRGEDHISNTPRQYLIQEALGFPMPKYAHLPLILGPDRSKLSKRHGAVSVSEYIEEGYLKE
ncbi:MAG: glutamate--tRNA ligase, partial [Patescibacteria group bacterium]|nr:glutamate--tRNA ligase [Patescibacteria group bacterium]